MLRCFMKQCWDWQFDTSSHGTMVSNNLGRESKKYLNTNLGHKIEENQKRYQLSSSTLYV